MAQVNVPNIMGGISYSAPSFNWGNTSQTIGGGLSFDLPLSTVSMFTSNALDFSARNTQNSQNFLTSVIGNAQANVTATVDKSYGFQQTSLNTAERVATGWQGIQQAGIDSAERVANGWMDVQRYAIKKAAKSGCFLTTIICKALRLPDDCDELQTLRSFRDNVLLLNEDDAKLVQQYYDEAPVIAELLEQLPNSHSVLCKLAQDFIYPAVAKIKFGREDEARQIYINLFVHAKAIVGV